MTEPFNRETCLAIYITDERYAHLKFGKDDQDIINDTWTCRITNEALTDLQESAKQERIRREALKNIKKGQMKNEQLD